MMNTKTLLGRCKQIFDRKSEVFIIFAFWLILMVVSSMLSNRFLTFYNLYSMLRGSIPLMLLSFGQCIVMTGTVGVDLSVGGMVSLVNCFLAIYCTQANGWVIPIIVSILIGVAAGLINGILSTKGRLQPLIVTLAMNIILGGAAVLVYPDASTQVAKYMNKDFFEFIAYGFNGWFPLVFIVLITVVFWLFLNRTKTGRACVAIGGNAYSAECSNINVTKINIICFVISAVLAVLAGIYTTAQTMGGNSNIGTPLVTLSITAAAIGGTSMSGGKGSVVGCVIATYVLYIINNILNMTGVNSYYQYLIQGILLVLALALAAFKGRKPTD